MAIYTSRDVHKFQSALLAVDQVLTEQQSDPRLVAAEDILQPYHATVYTLIGIGMATFLGVDPEEVWSPVTATNWRGRLQSALTCPKISGKEYELAHHAIRRLDLMPEELVRVRNLIEKVDRLRRQGEFQLELIDDDVPF